MNDGLSIVLAGLAMFFGLSAVGSLDAARREFIRDRIGTTFFWSAITTATLAACIACARIVWNAEIGLI